MIKSHVIMLNHKSRDERIERTMEAEETLRQIMASEATEEDMARAAESLGKSEMYSRRRQESYARCDTDGFLTQYFDGVSSSESQIQSRIDLQGGRDCFLALFDLDGKRVNADLRDGQYGKYWCLLDDSNRPTGKFVSAYPAKSSTLRKKGYQEGFETAPARACVMGSGRGLSGQCRASYERIKDS